MANRPLQDEENTPPSGNHVNADVLSVVVSDKDTPQKLASSFVHFVDVPATVGHRTPITCEYSCMIGQIIGVQLQVQNLLLDSVIVFHQKWRCKFDGLQRRTVILTLPDIYAYRPSLFNRDAQTVELSQLLLWKMDSNHAVSIKNKSIYFNKAPVKTSMNVAILNPFERPRKPTFLCPSWMMEIRMGQPFTPICEKQPEVFVGVSFPLALSGSYSGVHRMIPEYSEPVLIKERKLQKTLLKFTLSIWLYIVEYCPQNQPLCSIVQTLNTDETYSTPLIYINNKGQVHIQVRLMDRSFTAFLTSMDHTIPLLKWCHLVVTANNRQWGVTIKCDRAWKSITSNDFTIFKFKGPIYHDDTSCLTIFGGSEMAPAFKGYIGEAIIYRRKTFSINELPRKNPHDQIFELGLGEWNTKCHRYLVWSDYVKYQSKVLLERIIEKRSCKDPVSNIFRKDDHTVTKDQCTAYSKHFPRQYMLAYKTAQRLALDGVPYTREDIAAVLMANITAVLEYQGLLGIKDTIPLLRQASCYGNHDATFMLATILNNGMGTRVDEVQAHKYLMFGAMEGNVLNQLTLGNKHVMGLDGVTQDLEQAYVYYKTVAEQTKIDKEIHEEDGVITEHVWLTDERELDAQTDEEGDIFLWLKHQAQRGVVSAQQEMARMLYWGSRGVSRNTKSAANFYEMGAKKKDPTSLYNYGIVNMKGHGIPKNMTKAIELFEEAASHGFHLAHNVLGWIALEKGDFVTAAQHLMKAYQGGNVDAAHNLAFMHFNGKFPGMEKSRSEAFQFYSFAAQRGQLDSGIVVGQYNIRGGDIERNPSLAVEWARFIAEKNMALGKVLRKGLQAYRNLNWPSSVVYYHMAAETGLEAALFNTAYLCDENDDGLINYLEKDCIWRFYNLTSHRDTNHKNTYSAIKMGDYWYGHHGNKDVAKAATFYGYAAKQGDPQAFFNLGFMVENGAVLSSTILRDIRISRRLNDTTQLLVQLYSRCSNSKRSEANFVCSLALYRVKALEFWNHYSLLLKVSGALGAVLALVLTVVWIVNYARNQPRYVSNV